MIALAIALAAAGNINKTVDIDGKGYRVILKDGVVKVKNKALLTGQTVEDRARMIRAVKQVTGCEMHDPFWRGAALLGELRCTD